MLLIKSRRFCHFPVANSLQFIPSLVTDASDKDTEVMKNVRWQMVLVHLPLVFRSLSSAERLHEQVEKKAFDGIFRIRKINKWTKNDRPPNRIWTISNYFSTARGVSSFVQLNVFKNGKQYWFANIREIQFNYASYCKDQHSQAFVGYIQRKWMINCLLLLSLLGREFWICL